MLLAVALEGTRALLNAKILKLQQASAGIFPYNAHVKIDQM